MTAIVRGEAFCYGLPGPPHLPGIESANNDLTRRECVGAAALSSGLGLSRRLEAARRSAEAAARATAPDHAWLSKSMDRLLTAHQDGLMSLKQLRCRMPELR